MEPPFGQEHTRVPCLRIKHFVKTNFRTEPTFLDSCIIVWGMWTHIFSSLVWNFMVIFFTFLCGYPDLGPCSEVVACLYVLPNDKMTTQTKYCPLGKQQLWTWWDRNVWRLTTVIYLTPVVSCSLLMSNNSF